MPHRRPAGRILAAGDARIDVCLNCGQCASRCPYGLDPPALLRRNLADYRTFRP